MTAHIRLCGTGVSGVTLTRHACSSGFGRTEDGAPVSDPEFTNMRVVSCAAVTLSPGSPITRLLPASAGNCYGLRQCDINAKRPARTPPTRSDRIPRAEIEQ